MGGAVGAGAARAARAGVGHALEPLNYSPTSPILDQTFISKVTAWTRRQRSVGRTAEQVALLKCTILRCRGLYRKGEFRFPYIRRMQRCSSTCKCGCCGWLYHAACRNFDGVAVPGASSNQRHKSRVRAPAPKRGFGFLPGLDFETPPLPP